MKRPLSINLGGEIRDFTRPLVMGIVNATPDSFYGCSRVLGEEAVASRVAQMVKDGVDILDVGACSTRSGAPEVTAEEEFCRLEPVLAVIRERWPEMPVSVDTFRADVADKCIGRFGVQIINDVSGGTLDREIWDVAAERKAAYILMHMRGTPATMSSMTGYGDVTADVIQDLMRKAAELYQKGVADVVLDPGFGFAKTVEQNYRMLSELEEFKKTGLPLLVGMSRKSMLWRPLESSPEEVLPATIAAHTIALTKGADILRVHDVAPAVQSVKVWQMCRQSF